MKTHQHGRARSHRQTKQWSDLLSVLGETVSLGPSAVKLTTGVPACTCARLVMLHVAAKSSERASFNPSARNRQGSIGFHGFHGYIHSGARPGCAEHPRVDELGATSIMLEEALSGASFGTAVCSLSERGAERGPPRQCTRSARTDSRHRIQRSFRAPPPPPIYIYELGSQLAIIVRPTSVRCSCSVLRLLSTMESDVARSLLDSRPDWAGTQTDDLR